MKYEMESPTHDRGFRSGSDVTFPKILNSGLPLTHIREGYVVRGMLMEGEELFTLPSDIFYNGPKVGAAGDQWLHVVKIGGLTCNGHVAYKHMGVMVCDLTTNTDPGPNPTPTFPESFTLTDPSGAKAEYVFSRIIE